MRRWVKMFRPQFEPLIVSARKVSTIRPVPKRLCDWPEPGDILDARLWTGAPYRSQQESIGEFRITSVRLFCLVDTRSVFLDGVESIDQHDHHTLANEDGFRTWGNMVDWFKHEHGLPFIGIRIAWEWMD